MSAEVPAPSTDLQTRLRWLAAEFQASSWMMEQVKHLGSLDLPQGMLAAGFLRNFIWDRLHGLKNISHRTDLDVIYYDPSCTLEERDLELESRLNRLSPNPWSVKNQARMHQRNGHSPYPSCMDAMTYWPETATAVGVSLSKSGELKFHSPFDFEDNFAMLLKKSPLATVSDDFVRQRVENKGWLERWGKLRLQLEDAHE